MTMLPISKIKILVVPVNVNEETVKKIMGLLHAHSSIPVSDFIIPSTAAEPNTRASIFSLNDVNRRIQCDFLLETTPLVSPHYEELDVQSSILGQVYLCEKSMPVQWTMGNKKKIGKLINEVMVLEEGGEGVWFNVEEPSLGIGQIVSFLLEKMVEAMVIERNSDDRLD